MADVHAVAAYILAQQGQMTTMKLQKLVYYSQAWHLVWDGVPLFEEPVQAWMNGPVIPALYREHRGRFVVAEWPRGEVGTLTQGERETIDAVLGAYGALSPQDLSERTHSEAPWIEAREGLSVTDRSTRPISLDTMQEYYGAFAYTGSDSQ